MQYNRGTQYILYYIDVYNMVFSDSLENMKTYKGHDHEACYWALYYISECMYLAAESYCDETETKLKASKDHTPHAKIRRG